MCIDVQLNGNINSCQLQVFVISHLFNVLVLFAQAILIHIIYVIYNDFILCRDKDSLKTNNNKYINTYVIY